MSKVYQTFTICGVLTFWILMISLKLTELEGGYNRARLKRVLACSAEDGGHFENKMS